MFQPNPSHGSCITRFAWVSGSASPSARMLDVRTGRGGPDPETIIITKKAASPAPCTARAVGSMAPRNTPMAANTASPSSPPTITSGLRVDVHVGVFERGAVDVEVQRQDAAGGQRGGDVCEQWTLAANEHAPALLFDAFDARASLQPFEVAIFGREPDGAGAGELRDEPRGGVDRGDPAPPEHRDAVAQVFGFVHEVRDEYDGGSAAPNLAHQVPGGAAGSRVEPRGHLVEEHDFGFVHERERDEQSLPLASGEVAEGAIAFLCEVPLFEEPAPVARTWRKRREEVKRLPDAKAFG